MPPNLQKCLDIEFSNSCDYNSYRLKFTSITLSVHLENLETQVSQKSNINDSLPQSSALSMSNNLAF
jgi:hypothetical protein